jgi:hypothetical protein
MAKDMADLGAHKQIVNRLLEPFAHINVVVTATEWDNFFKLRRHPDAQPEIHELANQMWHQMRLSIPVEREHHLPYTTWEDPDCLVDAEGGPWGKPTFRSWELISAARCARVSYRTHDGKWSTPEEDIPLALDLRADGHLSPFEHQATAAEGQHANFQGWRALRQEL